MAEDRTGDERDDRLAARSVGWMPNASETNVIPINRTASRTAIAIIVSPAFFDSGGWKAGTPLAIASVPVRATDPLAKAFRSRKTPIPSEPAFTASACWTS